MICSGETVKLELLHLHEAHKLGAVLTCPQSVRHSLTLFLQRSRLGVMEGGLSHVFSAYAVGGEMQLERDGQRVGRSWPLWPRSCSTEEEELTRRNERELFGRAG